jgi:fructose-1,6-bisphosphatase I
VTNEDVLQKGSEQLASGYVIYGSSTMLVYTTGIKALTASPSLPFSESFFFLILSSDDCMIYSINESLEPEFDQSAIKYLKEIKSNQYTLRYTGSLLTHFHRNLLRSGICIYPRSRQTPNGKLRLLYECNALALICEQAGGMASDGENRVLYLQPIDFHQRTPFSWDLQIW